MKEVIVAIDFGTSGTTYAFAFLDAKDDIITAKWNIPDAKNSTQIILEEDDQGNLKVVQFGDNCKAYLGKKNNEEKNFYHFKDIKMKLYDNQTYIKSSNNDKKVKLEVVISKILITIKEKALNDILGLRPLTNESNIDWKVTVPAIWKNRSKEIMLKASKLAGLFNENDQSLFFCLEPEGAACDYISEKTSDYNAIEIGKPYIICDIGGGTIDISTHKRIKESDKIYIEEVYPPSGGNHGSSYINKNFMDRVIKKIFGKNAMDKLEKIINDKEDEDIYDEFCVLSQQIEEFKKISSDLKDDAKRIDCSLFEEIIEDDNISNLIKEYNNYCPSDWKIERHKGFKIFFPYKIMIDLTKEIIVDNVVNHLYNIIDDVSEINSIIYAGSVSSNQYIISLINNQLPNGINKYNSSYPSLAVAKGAVVFGLNPYIIKSRISKYTIGVDTREKWDELKHGTRTDLKIFDKKENCYYCYNCFSPIILKNKKINVDEVVKKNYTISYDSVKIVFLKTLFNDVKYTDETENNNNLKCIKFGETQFNIGEDYDENNKDLIIELKLGGTYINSKIIYNDIEKSIPFDFSNED